jgi:hypothetical protein
MGPFTISKELIAGLGDERLRELLSNLLEAEARRRGIAPAGIAVGGNQTAPDGGVDASIRWVGPPKPGAWLPRRHVTFQCKAETMAAGPLTKEMRPKGKVRPLFATLARGRSSYIVFSTDDPSNSGYERRIAAMRDALHDIPDGNLVHLDFFGADRIARWVNEHPGVALTLLEGAGRSVRGWRPYGGWSTPRQGQTPYVHDENTRARVDGNGVDVLAAIMAMRRVLSRPGGVARLIGISGMGKTRLAEALFEDEVNAGPPLFASKAIYGDAGHDLPLGSALLSEQLVATGVEAVIVVDNCTARTHGQLAEIIGRPGSRSSLLTIDYDVGEDRPADTLLVQLGDNSETVLRALLAQRRPKLSSSDRDHVARFAGGNARVALKIAEGAEDGVSLASLNDSELLDRLFQTERYELDVEAKRCAEVASLVYAFYAEDGDGQSSELPLLASLADVTEETLYRQIAIFLDFGLVQRRGPQRAVMPPPIANMLAADALRRIDPAQLATRLRTGPQRLFASFSRRIGLLHDVPEAAAIAKRLLGEGGILGEPGRLSNQWRAAFFNVAPAAPSAALYAIERMLVSDRRDAVTSGATSDRTDFAALLVHLAHDPTLFARAMDALLAFVVIESRSDERTITDYFLKRFWIFGSATLAGPDIRLAYIDRLLDDDDPTVRRLGVRALKYMASTNHFDSTTDSSFGSRPRSTEWGPAKGAEQNEWFGTAINRLVQLAKAGGAESEHARTALAQQVRSHVHAGYGDLILTAVKNVKCDGYWDAGWNAICETLSFDRESMSAALLADAEAFERCLRPREPTELFEAFVLGEPWRHWHPVGNDNRATRNVEGLAGAFGRCAIRKRLLIDDLINRALRSEGQTSVHRFGEGLGAAAPNTTALWEEMVSCFQALPPETRNPTLLAGFLKGAVSRDPQWVENRLDEFVDDPLFSGDILFLHPTMALGGQAMLRFSRALAAGVVSPVSFSGLMYGGATKSIPADDLARFLAELHAVADGVAAAINVLHMRFFGDRSDKREIAPSLIAAGRAFLADPRTFELESAHDSHRIAAVAKVVMEGEEGRETAVAICRALRASERSNRRHLREFEKIANLVRQRYLLVILDEILVHPDCSENLIKQFFGGLARDDDDQEDKVAQLDLAEVFDWMARDPADRALRLAQFVPYARRDGTGPNMRWTALARELIERAPDPITVLATFERRFWSGSGSGSFASRYERRRPMLEALADHKDRTIRNWARQARQRLDEDIAYWDTRERERESRFE